MKSARNMHDSVSDIETPIDDLVRQNIKEIIANEAKGRTM